MLSRTSPAPSVQLRPTFRERATAAQVLPELADGRNEEAAKDGFVCEVPPARAIPKLRGPAICTKSARRVLACGYATIAPLDESDLLLH